MGVLLYISNFNVAMDSSVFRRLVRYLVVLFLLFLVLDRGISLGLNELLKHSEIRFSRLYRGEMEKQVLILGSSRAVNAFYVPEIENKTNFSAVSMAYNGISMEVAEVVFLDYLDHNKDPEILFLEITNLPTRNEVLKELKLYSGMSHRIRRLTSEEYPTFSRISQIANTSRFNTELFLRALFYFVESDQNWINQRTLNWSALDSSSSEVIKSPFENADRGRLALLRIIDVCETRGIKVHLIVTPYLPSYRKCMIDYDQRLATFEALLPEGHQILDYSEFLVDPSHFADAIHINKTGSLILLSELIDQEVF